MGDIPHTLLYRLKRWWWRWETPFLRAFVVFGIAAIIAIPYKAELKAFMAALLVAILGGCSTVPQDALAHEERHCEGWTHTGANPFYVWHKTRPASAKPWVYINAVNADTACRDLGGDAAKGHRFIGCTQWRESGCIIILQEGK